MNCGLIFPGINYLIILCGDSKSSISSADAFINVVFVMREFLAV